MPETENGNRNKTETFKVRCTPQQRKEFDAEAERLGLSLSEFWFICFTDWRARLSADFLPVFKTPKTNFHHTTKTQKTEFFNFGVL